MNKDTAIRYVVDAQGQPQGVFLEEEMWQHVCKHVLSIFEKLYPTDTTFPEPMADLQLLEKYWDLRYELPTDVSCEHCGASTADWKSDDPRYPRIDVYGSFAELEADFGRLPRNRDQGVVAGLFGSLVVAGAAAASGAGAAVAAGGPARETLLLQRIVQDRDVRQCGFHASDLNGSRLS